MRKWFYVLELEGGFYYVGISGNAMRRVRQHIEGAGAEWTKLNKPLRVAFQYEHEVEDDRAAEALEDELTVKVMLEQGWQRVRGGHFCCVSEEHVVASLRSHGFWGQILKSSVSVVDCPDDWQEALAQVLSGACDFLQLPQSTTARDHLVARLKSLERHRYWRTEFAPSLDERYWGDRGILRVIITFKQNRVIGYKLQDPFAVLCACLQMGQSSGQPWRHLFLAAWDSYKPDATPIQEAKLRERLVAAPSSVPDRRYDAFTAVLFPEMRSRLRARSGEMGDR